MTDMAYSLLPSVREARSMVRWVECPAHGFKVGLDLQGRLVGRCPTCAVHAAQALLVIERGDAT